MNEVQTASRRDYMRLKALVMANRSCEMIDLCELLRLAEDPAAPPSDEGAYEWAIRFAIPVIKALGDRLTNKSNKIEGMPRFIRLVRSMRKEQRGKNKSLRESLENKVDEILSAELQPSLFEEAAV